MNVTLTNLSPVPVPLTTSRAGGSVATLEPGAAYPLDDAAETIVTVGDNPSFREDVEDFLVDVVHAFAKLVTFWRDHAPRRVVEGKHHPLVKLKIDNRGTHGLRVVLGDDRDADIELQPGEMTVAEAQDYLEIREMVSGQDPAASEDQAG